MTLERSQPVIFPFADVSPFSQRDIQSRMVKGPMRRAGGHNEVVQLITPNSKPLLTKSLLQYEPLFPHL